MNRDYLEALRSRTCYPTFRGFVHVFAWLGYLAAALLALVGIWSNQIGPTLLSIAGAVMFGLLVRAGTEMSLMVADIADVGVDQAAANPVLASRNDRTSSERIPRPANEQRD